LVLLYKQYLKYACASANMPWRFWCITVLGLLGNSKPIISAICLRAFQGSKPLRSA
jgi:hypothetical protein